MGLVCWKLGAGRSSASDAIDHTVGLVLLTKPGLRISKGDAWVEVLHAEQTVPADLLQQVENAITITDRSFEVHSRILRII